MAKLFKQFSDAHAQAIKIFIVFIVICLALVATGTVFGVSGGLQQSSTPPTQHLITGADIDLSPATPVVNQQEMMDQTVDLTSTMMDNMDEPPPDLNEEVEIKTGPEAEKIISQSKPTPATSLQSSPSPDPCESEELERGAGANINREDKAINSILLSVDKDTSIPQEAIDSVINKLVLANDLGIPTLYHKEIFIHQEMTGDLIALFAAAQNDGINLTIRSGFRTKGEQLAAYQKWEDESPENVDTLSAQPGFSEHQLGTTIDFATAENKFQLIEEFDDTQAGKWLLENAPRFGFVLSYPEDSTDQSGYIYEPWHWRWIGKELAQQWWDQWNSTPRLLLNEWLLSINPSGVSP